MVVTDAFGLRVAARFLERRALVNRRFISVRVARRFMAGLGDQLENRMQALLSGPLDVSEGRRLGAWLEENFHFQGAKTPRGGKSLKGALQKLHWWLFGIGMNRDDPESARPTLEDAWSDVQSHLGEIVKLFSDEGGVKVPKQVTVGPNTYRNLSGFTEKQLQGYIKALEQVFSELKGWHKRALVGGLYVALAGPSEFRGTTSGKYKFSADTLYVRATPKILHRTRGTYAAFDYIIIHELGHRYQAKYRVSQDFDRPEWWTSRYSRNEGESFAELFALSNFGMTGPWDQSVVERFEAAMAGGKVQEQEPNEWPEHLRRAKEARATPAEAVAVNLLVNDPDLTLPEAIKLVREYPDELYDDVSGQMVPPRDVLKALEKLMPEPVHGGDIKVYHATDRSTSQQLLRRGFIPETKPRPRDQDFEYAPGKGIDAGLYVGATPSQVDSYGPVTLELVVPKKFLEVPTELAQHGERDPMKALRSHDGAVINKRLPPDVFRFLS